MMQDAFGWTADQFWQATPHDAWACVDERIRANKQNR
jgi:hypothetical protein